MMMIDRCAKTSAEWELNPDAEIPPLHLMCITFRQPEASAPGPWVDDRGNTIDEFMDDFAAWLEDELIKAGTVGMDYSLNVGALSFERFAQYERHILVALPPSWSVGAAERAALNVTIPSVEGFEFAGIKWVDALLAYSLLHAR
jgi:hypothetical protein